MGLRDTQRGGRLSARELRAVGRDVDAARPMLSANAASQLDSGNGGGAVPADPDWFPVEILTVEAGTPDGYTFKEVWTDDTHEPVEKEGGRVNSADDPAYPIPAGVVFEVGDHALCRRAPGTAGETWELVAVSAVGDGDPPAGGTACSPAGGWTSLDCLSLSVVSAAGDCADIDTTQVLSLAYDTDHWESGDDAVDDPEDDFVHDLGLGPAVFTFVDGQPRLTLDAVEGFYVGCSGTGLLFSFGGPLLCDSETPHVGCADNSFTVLISCECCPVAGYTTAGWYRVLPLGVACDDECSGACVYLADECAAAGYVICAGPFADEEECGDPVDCPPDGSIDWQCDSHTATTQESCAADPVYLAPGHWAAADGSWDMVWAGGTWTLTATAGGIWVGGDTAGAYGDCATCITVSSDNAGNIDCGDGSGLQSPQDIVFCCGDPCDEGAMLAAAQVAARVGRPAKKAKPARTAAKPKPARCKHLGDEPLTVTEKKRLNLPLANTWSPCSHPDQPKGANVCPCRGCNAKCPGYEAAQTE
jgi:hypothetical protein